MMPTPRYRDQVIALAALLQACWLIDQLSKTGAVSSEQLNPLLQSLFVFDPGTAEEVYGTAVHLKRGLQILEDMLNGSTPRQYGETLRYALSVMHLQRKLAQKPAMLQQIRRRLEHIAFRYTHFTDDSSALAGSIAGLYQDTISNFRFRVQVTGSMRHLSNERIAAKVRSLLFSGIRAALLWRQVGGSRLKLLLQRRALRKALIELRAEKIL